MCGLLMLLLILRSRKNREIYLNNASKALSPCNSVHTLAKFAIGCALAIMPRVPATVGWGVMPREGNAIINFYSELRFDPN